MKISGHKKDNTYKEFKVVKSYKMFPEMFSDLYPFSDTLVCIYTSIKNFLATPWHREFPGQRLDPCCKCDKRCSCSNAGSLTHSSHLDPGAAEMPPVPIEPQQELLTNFNAKVKHR